MWTPGVSTGPLKVTTVFWFQSSAFTLGENAAPMSAAQNTVGTAFKKVTFTPLI
jgi:hypothetical protein